MLQETHSVKEDQVLWNKDWGSEILLNHGTSNSRGTLLAFGNEVDYKILKHINDGNGRLQICSIAIEGNKFLLVNVYNNNTENEQITTIQNLDKMLESVDEILEHEIIIGGDFNFILDKELDAYGGNPLLKLKSIAEITKLKQKYNLCDIYRIRNPTTKRYTFFKKKTGYAEDSISS